MAKKTKKRIVEINLDDIARLGALQCTKTELAAFLGISMQRLNKIFEKFPEVVAAWESGREQGKTSLRRKQYRLAATSASMAIHLGKNYLNQKDAQTLEHTGKDGGPIQTMDLSKLDQNERDKLRELLLRAKRSEPTN